MLFESITLEQIAGHFFLSISQFSRLFKEATGASPWAYITAKRLIRAREYLQDGLSAKKTQKCAASVIIRFSTRLTPNASAKSQAPHFGEKQREALTRKSRSVTIR